MLHIEVCDDAVLIGWNDSKGCAVEYRVWCWRCCGVGSVKVDDPGMLVADAANGCELW
jgi:hypothetical protein